MDKITFTLSFSRIRLCSSTWNWSSRFLRSSAWYSSSFQRDSNLAAIESWSNNIFSQASRALFCTFLIPMWPWYIQRKRSWIVRQRKMKERKTWKLSVIRTYWWTPERVISMTGMENGHLHWQGLVQRSPSPQHLPSDFWKM